MFVLKEILLEIFKVTWAWLAKRPAVAAMAGVLGVVIVIAVGLTVLSRFFFPGERDPYSYRCVSGDVLYEDGGVIPVDTLTLTFIPLSPPLDPRRYPRPGFVSVDPKTGAFQSVTSRKPGDGIAKGAHKVVIAGANRRPLPEELVPNEYADFNTTPLEVDTKNGVFHLKVKRPGPTVRKTDSKLRKAAL